MAVLTGVSSSFSVGSGGGNRESLEDVIHDLFPEDTYALTNFDKVSAEATYHEWLADEPDAAASNIAVEGNDATFAVISNPTRYGNYTQICEKTFAVSGTQERVKKAGRKSEVARQAIRKMREMKRDMEFAITRNAIATAGATATGRSSAGIESWIQDGTTNATIAGQVVSATVQTSGTTPAVASGTPGTALTDGTAGALTEAQLKLALEGAWEDGGDTDVILVSAKQKKVIDAFTGVTTRNIDISRTDQAVITGASNVYVSSFGVHKVVQHRYMRDSVALCLDTSMWAIAYLRRPFKQNLAKTGDSQKCQLLAEFCLVARNPDANAKVVDCS